MRLAISILFALSCSLAAQQADSDLVGLWGVEHTFGPQVRGPFTLERHASTWTLRAGGFEVSTPLADKAIRIALPGGAGELRGTIEQAFWIQPRGNLGQFATPVKLEPIGAGAWRGNITPLDDRLSLYLLITRDEDGSLKGSFHNPEVNWTGRAPWFRVVKEGESIKLIDPATGKQRFSQPYDAGQRTIAMDFGAPIALTTRTREQAVGFLPRSPAATTYRYRVPLDHGDGWRTAHARDAGMDEKLLRELVERLINTDPAVPGSPRIHSLVVARHGKLVLDEYFFGFTPDRPHDLRSASKTFTSLMVGVAMDRDQSLTIDSPIDAAHPRITLGHLLAHSSGLACDDDDEKSPGHEDTMQNQQKQSDWYRYFLDLPVVHPPGTKYAYCSAGINFAAGIVGKRMKAWLPELFDRHVARPLQIEQYHMNLMPNGQAYGGGGIYMRPRDFMKLGQTYLGGGIWNGKRIVSKEWVKTSTAHQIQTSGGGSDGFAWHRFTLRAGDRNYEEFEASGNGGQFVIVVPELDLVIGITAGNYGQYRIWKTFREELVPRYILSAVTDTAPRGCARGE